MIRPNTITWLVATVIPLVPGMVLAQGVGNLGQLPPVLHQNTVGTGWEVGVPSPIPVERDPLGPVWRKALTDPLGGPFTALPGQTYHLHEVLVIGGQLPWSDWHEDILNPEWSWTGAQILINGNIPSGLVINNVPGTSLKGGTISFLFDSVQPGSVVDIFKHLTYADPFNAAIPPFTGVLHVNQYPTPEPVSLALLALGGLTLLRRKTALRG